MLFRDLSEYDQYVEVERNGVVAVQRLPTEEDETVSFPW